MEESSIVGLNFEYFENHILDNSKLRVLTAWLSNWEVQGVSTLPRKPMVGLSVLLVSVEIATAGQIR